MRRHFEYLGAGGGRSDDEFDVEGGTCKWAHILGHADAMRYIKCRVHIEMSPLTFRYTKARWNKLLNVKELGLMRDATM
jgi:hypothetical protein